MEVFVPFDAAEPKTRLAPVLDDRERNAFAGRMLRDVLETLETVDTDVTVLATGAVECSVPVVVDDQPLTAAVNSVLTDADGPVAIVMADLALVTKRAIERLFAPESDVVLAPGRGGGTNAIVTREPDFRVDFHGVSIRDHLAAAKACDAQVETVDSYRLACDIDEPDDLLEVLLHSDRRAATWLREAGFTIAPNHRATPIGLSREQP
ncbi:MAG: 2-phospho-L-lactate guanylyltransferase [Halovenus sp.]